MSRTVEEAETTFYLASPSAHTERPASKLGSGSSEKKMSIPLVAGVISLLRNVAVLFGRKRLTLIGNHLEGLNQASPALGRHDHCVNVAA